MSASPADRPRGRHLARRIVPALAILALAPAALAATITVAPDGSGDVATIQEALDTALAGDIVELMAGEYHGPGNRDCGVWATGMTVRSQSGDPATVTIACDGSAAEPHRFLNVQGFATGFTLEGVTITGGHAGGGRIPGGGALLITSGSDAVITDCVFVDNHAAMQWDNAGGAVYVDGSCDPTFTGCVFRENSGYFGGAVGLNHYSHATFTDCTFVDNVGGRGGAIWGNCTTKIHCVFLRNSAEQGGALWGNGYNAEVSVNCTYAANSSPLGGAIYAEANYGSPVRLENTLVAFSLGGAGVWAGDGVPLEITCCDLHANEGGDWVGNLAGLEEVDGNFGAPPCFCDLAGDDLALCADSFCLPGHHPWGCDGLVGALGEGCGSCDCEGVVAVRQESWTDLRDRFR
jgi:hypothetical protein